MLCTLGNAVMEVHFPFEIIYVNLCFDYPSKLTNFAFAQW